MAYELEPAVREAVRKQQALYPRPPEQMSPAEILAVFGAAPPADQSLRPAGVAVEDGVVGLEEPAREIHTRRFRAGSMDRPVVLYFHGGAFTTGGLESHDLVCARLAAELPAEVLAVDCRKLPLHPFPAAYEDAVGIARKLATSGRPLALAGDSSGANLALAAAMSARGTMRLAGLLLYYPIIGLDFTTKSYVRNADGPLLSAARCRRIWSDYLSGDVDGVRARRDWRAAPLLADDFGGLPPTVIAVADYDPLLSDGTLLAERLKASGEATLIRGARLPHGFLRWRDISTEADKAIAAATRAFAAIL
jgi:acetyl esterase